MVRAVRVFLAGLMPDDAPMPEIKKMGRLARRNANRRRYGTTPAGLGAPRHAAMAGPSSSTPASASTGVKTSTPLWAKIRVRHAEAAAATGSWQKRVEAAEKGVGWTGASSADVVERRGALLTLNVDALDGSCAEELSMVTATCPPNGLPLHSARSTSPDVRRPAGGEQRAARAPARQMGRPP